MHTYMCTYIKSGEIAHWVNCLLFITGIRIQIPKNHGKAEHGGRPLTITPGVEGQRLLDSRSSEIF